MQGVGVFHLSRAGGATSSFGCHASLGVGDRK
jgi:hypothetical protein